MQDELLTTRELRTREIETLVEENECLQTAFATEQSLFFENQRLLDEKQQQQKLEEDVREERKIVQEKSIHTLQQRLDGAQKENQSLQEMLDGAQVSLLRENQDTSEKFQRENQALQERLDDAQIKSKKQNQEMSDRLQAENETLKERLDDAQITSTRLQKQNQEMSERLQRENQTFQERLDDAQISSQRLQRENQTFKEKLDDAQISSERLQRENQTIQDTSERLQRENQGLREVLDATQAATEKLQRENQILQEILDTIPIASEQLQKENQTLQEMLVSVQLRNHTLQERLDSALAELQRTERRSPEAIDIAQWNVPRNDIHTDEEIGRGAWGVIMRGTYRGNSVAVKLPHQDILNEHLMRRLKRETLIMIQIQHPNLVRIVAAVFDETAENLRLPPMIITELLDINLRQCYLRRRLQPTSRIPIFLDVAYGLHYLHDRQEPIIHRDVSAPNVLLKALPNGTWRAKVSDFGSANLARFSVTPGEGAIIYTAPEAMPGQSTNSPPVPHTTKIDVFSFGILLLEVITAEQPDPDLYQERLSNVMRVSRPVHGLVVRCTDRAPERRPRMANIIDELNDIDSP